MSSNPNESPMILVDDDGDDVGDGTSESVALDAIFCSVDVISVVIKRQSRRNADAMQNNMLTNHVATISTHDFSPDMRE